MKFFKSAQKTIILLLVGLLLGGCASTAIKTGYLGDYAKLQKGKYLENYWVNTSLIDKGKYSNIYVEKIDVSKIMNCAGVTTKEAQRWLQDALTNYDGLFVFKASPDVQAKLDIAITEMTPGDAGARMFAGELGMGHAWVQVEGKIEDIKSGKEIIVFSDRRRSSGAIGLRDIGGDVGPTLVREMLEQIAADLAAELKDIL